MWRGGMDKVKTTIEIDKGLDERFRKAVISSKGFHKGVLGEALAEAIELWIQTEAKKRMKTNG